MRAGKILKGIMIAAIVTGGAGLAFTVFCNQSLKTNQKTYDVDQMDEILKADYAIVPGCLVYKNGRPSYALEDRLNGALKLYRQKRAEKIILSGAARENQAGKRFLMDRKVPSEDLLIDDGGLDTYSTVYRCSRAFPGKRFFICTQQKYFQRTGFLISELKMDGACVKIDAHTYKKEIYERFRDFFAADKAWIECKITKPEPQYSLKEMPIQ